MSQLDSHNEFEVKQDEDVIQATIGNFGRWQFKMSALMALLKFPIAWVQLSIVFLAPPTQFWCKSDFATNSTNEWVTAASQNQSFLRHEGLNSGFCQSFDSPGTSCDGYTYNRSVFHSSIVTEWDLVCENKRLVDVSQITLMLGVLIGNILFGVLADRYGRKKTLLTCIVFQSLLGIAASQIPWYWAFVVVRFFLAIANGGTIVISFVMCMEVVGGPWRSIVPILYQIPYGFGNSIMAGLAYFYRDWRNLHLALSLLSSFYIFYLWFLPESPRWLLATGNKAEAMKILEQAAECNKMDTNKVHLVANSLSFECKKEKKSVSALFATKELAKRNLLLCINWLIAGVTFYAFSQYAGKVGSNLYFTAAISGFVAFPGTLLCVLVIRRYGRRLTIASAHILTAICFFGILAVPAGVYYEDWPRVVIAGIGIVGLSISMPALYLFTGELFPTTIRNAGVGTSVMFSRMGSMLAPLVITLQDISPSLPLIILGAGAIFETFLILFLPETKGAPLPETLDDLEVKMNNNNKMDSGRNEANMCYISLPTILKDTSLDISKV